MCESFNFGEFIKNTVRARKERGLIYKQVEEKVHLKNGNSQ